MQNLCNDMIMYCSTYLLFKETLQLRLINKQIYESLNIHILKCKYDTYIYKDNQLYIIVYFHVNSCIRMILPLKFIYYDNIRCILYFNDIKITTHMAYMVYEEYYKNKKIPEVLTYEYKQNNILTKEIYSYNKEMYSISNFIRLINFLVDINILV